MPTFHSVWLFGLRYEVTRLWLTNDHVHLLFSNYEIYSSQDRCMFTSFLFLLICLQLLGCSGMLKVAIKMSNNGNQVDYVVQMYLSSYQS